MDKALKRFANYGYAGTSVQDIVDDAQVTKPTMYYHFGNKSGLYQALVDFAYDERYRLMRAAEPKGHTLEEKLTEIMAAVFEFLLTNREVMRIAFSTAFAAPGEIPEEIKFQEKGDRNYGFIRGLIQEGQAKGELAREFDADEIARSFWGNMNIYVMMYLVKPDFKICRHTAEQVVKLFFSGVRARR